MTIWLFSDTLSQLIKVCGPEVTFKINFLHTGPNLREMIDQDAYKSLRDGEIHPGVTPVRYSTKFTGLQAKKFLKFSQLYSKCSRDVLNKLTDINVIWTVDHNTEVETSLLVYVSCMVKKSSIRILMPKDQILPFKPRYLEECPLCEKISNGNWIQLAQCDCKVHQACHLEVILIFQSRAI